MEQQGPMLNKFLKWGQGNSGQDYSGLLLGLIPEMSSEPNFLPCQKRFGALGCCVLSFRGRFCVWRLQEAAHIFSQPGSQTFLSAGAVSISTLSWLRLLCQGPGRVLAANLRGSPNASMSS
jgi:hypothetical protein